MDNIQILSRRASFEASLRRSGWDEDSITYEWFKVQTENQMYDIFKGRMDEPTGYLSGMEFLQKYNKVV